MLRNQLISIRPSTAVDVMFANPLTGTVDILFQTGHAYVYKNVSRRAIANLLLNPNMSLGFWVNDNLLPYDCKSRLFGECRVLPAIFASAMPIAA